MGARLVVVDNYDSFTWNLVALLERLGLRCDVIPNDGCSEVELFRRPADGYLVSPGPSHPRSSGLSRSIMLAALKPGWTRPVLGVCLGHQTLADVLGGLVRHAVRAAHGKSFPIVHDGRGIFEGLDSPLEVCRYNSLSVEERGLPAALEISARDSDGEIMALRHRNAPIETVQFHPESAWTQGGEQLLGNFAEAVALSAK